METTETGATEKTEALLPANGLEGWLLGMSRDSIARAAGTYASEMDGGRLDPLRALLMARKAAGLFAGIERAARARLDLHLPRGERLMAHGCEIAERETGVRYDYTVCGDAEWESLNGQVEELAARRREREAFLRTVPARRMGPDGACANPVFGAEGTELMPPLRTAALGYAVTVK